MCNVDQLSTGERQALLRRARGRWINKILMVHGSTRVHGLGYEYDDEPRSFVLYFEDEQVYMDASLLSTLNSENFTHKVINEDELDYILENASTVFRNWIKE